MFDETEVIEFFNRIINAPDLSNQEIKTNVTKFYEYLVLTKMCDEESLTRLSKIVNCLNEIIVIKNQFGSIDVNNLLLEQDKTKKLVKKPKKQTTKHYNHYVDDDYVSGCAGRPNVTTVRKSLSSSSCGCSSSSYTSRC